MNHYQVDYRCTNCGLFFIKSWPQGTLAPATTACSQCGCVTAQKCLTPGKRTWESRKELL